MNEEEAEIIDDKEDAIWDSLLDAVDDLEAE